MFKPFKPPLLKRIQSKSAPIDLTESSDHGSESESDEEPTHRPAKRRRLLVHVVEDSPPRPKIQTSSAVSAPRKPLIVKSTNEPKPAQPDSQSPEGYYMVLWYLSPPRHISITNSSQAQVHSKKTQDLGW